jgi:hypothetical protein
VAGALAGAGGVALIGMGPAYVLVTLMYVVAAACRPASPGARRRTPRRATTMAELKDGFRYAVEQARPDRHVRHGVPRQPARLSLHLGLLP